MAATILLAEDQADIRDLLVMNLRGAGYDVAAVADGAAALASQTDHKRMVMGGDCYNYALLASGNIDLVCEANLKLHDWAALVPVIEGAGGTVCDWNGDPLHAASDGHVLALGDPARLEDAVEALACGH